MDKQKADAHIRFKAIVQVIGTPKEHVEKTLAKYIDQVKNTEDLMVMNADVAEAKEHENIDPNAVKTKADPNPQQKEDRPKMWATFAELEIVAKGLNNVAGFCFDYMPASIDIIKPETLELNSNDLSNLFNDLQLRSHNVDMYIKKLNVENDVLKRNMNTVLKNAILVSLTRMSMEKDMISKATGINTSTIDPFLNDLIKDQKIKKDGELYSVLLKNDREEGQS